MPRKQGATALHPLADRRRVDMGLVRGLAPHLVVDALDQERGSRIAPALVRITAATLDPWEAHLAAMAISLPAREPFASKPTAGRR
jgi:hypothetical protein